MNSTHSDQRYSGKDQPWPVAQLVRALSREPKGRKFRPRSGHIREAADPHISLTSTFLSLSLLPPTLKSLSRSSGEDLKIDKYWVMSILS